MKAGKYTVTYILQIVMVTFVCLADWKPKTLNVSQLGSNLHVAFESAPASFGFHFYYLYYKLRQDGPFRTQRCKPVSLISCGSFRAPTKYKCILEIGGF